jgi:hypothetical protein
MAFIVHIITVLLSLSLKFTSQLKYSRLVFMVFPSQICSLFLHVSWSNFPRHQGRFFDWWNYLFCHQGAETASSKFLVATDRGSLREYTGRGAPILPTPGQGFSCLNMHSSHLGNLWTCSSQVSETVHVTSKFPEILVVLAPLITMSVLSEWSAANTVSLCLCGLSGHFLHWLAIVNHLRMILASSSWHHTSVSCLCVIMMVKNWVLSKFTV